MHPTPFPFTGWPYLATQVRVGQQHIILLPQGFALWRMHFLAQRQASEDRLPVWLVLGADDVMIFEPDGTARRTVRPPTASVVAGTMTQAAPRPFAQELLDRQERLLTYAGRRRRWEDETVRRPRSGELAPWVAPVLYSVGLLYSSIGVIGLGSEQYIGGGIFTIGGAGMLAWTAHLQGHFARS